MAGRGETRRLRRVERSVFLLANLVGLAVLVLVYRDLRLEEGQAHAMFVAFIAALIVHTAILVLGLTAQTALRIWLWLRR